MRYIKLHYPDKMFPYNECLFEKSAKGIFEWFMISEVGLCALHLNQTLDAEAQAQERKRLDVALSALGLKK